MNEDYLEKCLQQVNPDHTRPFWRLDRLGRSIRHLIDLVADLHQRGVRFKSLCDGAIDTTTASGELIFHVFSALAQFERRLIVERTNAGRGLFDQWVRARPTWLRCVGQIGEQGKVQMRILVAQKV